MMRLWNRNTSNGVANGQPQPPGQSSTASTASTAATSKRRLRESNSIEDSNSKDVIKSPKPSAKTKKIDQETNKNKNNNSQQLVQTQHEVTPRGHQEKRGKITFSCYIFMSFLKTNFVLNFISIIISKLKVFFPYSIIL